MVLSRLAALSGPPPGPQNASSETPTNTKTKNDTENEAETDGKSESEEIGWGRAVLGRVRALSVSGQQHGTVFWKTGARQKLEGLGELGPRETLAEVRSSVREVKFSLRSMGGGGYLVPPRRVSVVRSVNGAWPRRVSVSLPVFISIVLLLGRSVNEGIVLSFDGSLFVWPKRVFLYAATPCEHMTSLQSKVVCATNKPNQTNRTDGVKQNSTSCAAIFQYHLTSPAPLQTNANQAEDPATQPARHTHPNPNVDLWPPPPPRPAGTVLRVLGLARNARSMVN